MSTHDVLDHYVETCRAKLLENTRALSALRSRGVSERFLFESFSLGYADGGLPERVEGSNGLHAELEKAGALKNGREVLAKRLVVPIHDENKAVVNVVGYSLHPQAKRKVLPLNAGGIFNAPFLQHAEEIIFTEDPVDALFLIQRDIANVSFVFGDDGKYVEFLQRHGIRSCVFTFEGRTRLFNELTSAGISVRRVVVDFRRIGEQKSGEEWERIFSVADQQVSDDAVQEIENGFLFQLPHLSYRVIGNFSEHTTNLRVNIKAFTAGEVFVDTVDLYKNRDRQSFVFNIMDRFGIRDQLQLEQDLTRIIDVIEKHKETKAQQKKRIKPELTDYQRDVGMRLLTNPDLVEEIAQDYGRLGYVREPKNKLLLYLVMTSRLMDNPLHTILISRSGAGKSRLVEITETMCPPEDVESVSDLSAQALYYYGKDDLKHRFIVIGERQGSEGSEYPLRELISKKSIIKAIPMKDPVSGQIKTVSIKVEGPIALAETTTNGEVNPENLNRCFVVGIDESEEQTRCIHTLQRRSYTVDGYIEQRELPKIIDKHVYAQRLLRKLLVFNPFAPLLSFPSSKLKTRRDHDKFLRLINVICFLHQYQRKVKRLKGTDGEETEYIECTPADYALAYELLSDGVLDNTLDDLPRPARELLDLIKGYITRRFEQEGTPPERVIFSRKDIREHSSWSFAQVRNNFRTLLDYEYVQLLAGKNGAAHQYRLSGEYRDLDFLHTILSPEELQKKLKEGLAAVAS